MWDVGKAKIRHISSNPKLRSAQALQARAEWIIFIFFFCSSASSSSLYISLVPLNYSFDWIPDQGVKWWNVVLSHRFISMRRVGIDNRDGDELGLVEEYCFLSKKEVDKGLKVIACGVLRLRKLVTLAGTEMGLMSLSEGCRNLEELELHRCCDSTLCAIAAFENLRVLRLNGNVGGGCITDMGLTILAQGCTFLVKLKLSGCEGSYDCIKAIGQCCQMLEELVITDHKFDDGWLAAIPYFPNLRSLSFGCCKKIDDCPGPDEEYLSCCTSLVRLYLDKCQLRNSESLDALFKVCEAAEEIAICK